MLLKFSVNVWAFQNSFKWHLSNYEDYLRSKFQLSLLLFTGVIALKSPKIGPEPKKYYLFLLDKVKNSNYSEAAETWHPESRWMVLL